jgi:ectoine hydroxylase-related dioxygenase (phytanoyl-CoA dioxygenase family)
MERATLTLEPDELAAGALSSTTVTRAAGLFDHFGYLVIPRAFETDLICNLQNGYFELIARGLVSGRGRGMDVGDRRYMIPVEMRAPFDDPRLYAAPRLLPILERLLGADLVLDSFGSVIAMPGAAAQARHKDHDLLFDAERGARLPCHAVTLVVPLIDLDAETGTTAILPGSHRVALGATVDVEPALPLIARGGCYLMDYRLSHFGTANRSTRIRPILYIVYSRPWFRDERNFYSLPALAMPAEARARVPLRLRGLLARLEHAEVVVA